MREPGRRGVVAVVEGLQGRRQPARCEQRPTIHQAIRGPGYHISAEAFISSSEVLGPMIENIPISMMRCHAAPCCVVFIKNLNLVTLVGDGKAMLP